MRQRKHKAKRITLGVAILIIAYMAWALLRPIPGIEPTATALHQSSTSSKLSWPTSGQSAVGIVGSSILETHGTQTPTPTASTAKLITALLVLHAKPLNPNQLGPTVTLSDADVALYNNYLAQQGSVMRIQTGEQINEYQMLQALLLPSANNIADSLAVWAYGSLSAYATAANSFLAQHGLTNTHVGGDASGFQPNTTSTARDLVIIGELAVQNPVIAQIASQSTATGLPLVGTINNVNVLLGSHNITGLKTGNTDQAGGVFVSASHTVVNGKTVTIVTALANSATLGTALRDSVPLIQSAQANFQPVSITVAGAVVAHYKAPWGATAAAVASETNPLTRWSDSVIPAIVKLDRIKPGTTPGQTIGHIIIPASGITARQSIPVTLQTTLAQPSASWRLQHPFTK